MDFCGVEGISQSELGAKAIEAFIDKTTLTIKLEENILSALEKWASEERRLTEHQAQLIIEKTIKRNLDKRTED